MSKILAVHHPMEPTLPPFDFWSWRLYRRLTIDRISALVESGLDAISPVARGLENETLQEEALEPVLDLVRDHGMVAPLNMRDLFLATAELTERLGLPVEALAPFPAINPDWDAIPMAKPGFAGTIDGVSLRARLPETTDLIPPYRVIWQVGGSEETSEDLTHNPIGLFVPQAKPVWDWLFARRLTLLAGAGALPWPDAAHPPIVLPGEWDAPSRPF